MDAYTLMRLASIHLGWSAAAFLDSTPRNFFRSLDAHVKVTEHMTRTTEKAQKQAASMPEYRYIDEIPEKMRGAIL